MYNNKAKYLTFSVRYDKLNIVRGEYADVLQKPYDISFFSQITESEGHKIIGHIDRVRGLFKYDSACYDRKERLAVRPNRKR